MERRSKIQQETKSVKIKQETIEDSVNNEREQKLQNSKADAYGKLNKRNLEVIDLVGGGSRKEDKIMELNSVQEEYKKIP